MPGNGNKVLPFPNRAQAPSSTQAPSSEDHINEIREALLCLTAAMARSQRQVQVIHRILENMEDQDKGDATPPRLTQDHNCAMNQHEAK
jgi:hypothetical protein